MLGDFRMDDGELLMMTAENVARTSRTNVEQIKHFIRSWIAFSHSPANYWVQDGPTTASHRFVDFHWPNVAFNAKNVRFVRTTPFFVDGRPFETSYEPKKYSLETG